MIQSSIALVLTVLVGYMVVSFNLLNKTLPEVARLANSRSLTNDEAGHSMLQREELTNDEAGHSMLQREDRFPSVEERVKLYMSNWYVPPCNSYNDGWIRYEYNSTSEADGSEWPVAKIYGYYSSSELKQGAVAEIVDSIIASDKIFLLDDGMINHCAIPILDFNESTITDKRELEMSSRIVNRAHKQGYCQDIQESFIPARNHIQSKSNIKKEYPPVLLQFGDEKGTTNVPVIMKFRSSVTEPIDLKRVTSKHCYSTPREPMNTVHHTQHFQPIIWKLNTKRHYGNFDKVYKYDKYHTAWETKKNVAIFRGALNGIIRNNRTLTDEEKCMKLERCQLVYENANSTIIDAKLTNARGRVPDILNGISLVSDVIRVQDMLKYKGLIIIEGNDVASGLKWALLSQSVVLMAPPKHTSWAMEELLEPWVHYVPLENFGTDVETKMQWIIDNDSAAQRISKRASLWIEDLVFHPDAINDDRRIQREIVRRYRAHFQKF